ncbi:FRG domain-containing protein [Pseudomonas fitomaticsae]|uniref:FRG domain-containing protein n=1 Tax=Pseudomonas fitomaticsae TaxID=2837969 RepID=A0ABY3Q9D5_9PSED|nr:FRG domain-containing protein [Pseudomonas fitomaticsae]UFQ02754.1 FRG domain-containing protein [Pseudomonas fitomaticsae]
MAETAKAVKAHGSYEARDLISYLSIIYSLSDEPTGPRCYRGQSVSSWKVKPSVMRELKSDAERQILSELLVEAPNEFGSDKSMFDKLVRAQHYSLPTRLLDVTLNPLVGLYFACEEERFQSEDGVVQVFDFQKGREKFSDSDTVSIICNLSRLSDVEKKKIINRYDIVGPRVADWSELNKKMFRLMPEVKRLMQFVRVEKPYFLDKINPLDLFRYYFVYPSKNNRRVIAQSGAFIAAGLLQYHSLEQSAGLKHKKIIIPYQCKKKIVTQLDALNINSRTMFPEVEFTSKYIKKKWVIGSD